jgi:hypothetical protein
VYFPISLLEFVQNVTTEHSKINALQIGRTIAAPSAWVARNISNYCLN